MATAMVLGCFVMVGLLLAYYGKDRMNYFTEGEVAAAEYLSQTAPKGSLWLDGTWNWPNRYKKYEQYQYESLMTLPKDERGRLGYDPVGVIAQLMQDSRYPAAYLTITRSQKMHVETAGVMPEGSLDRIEEALRQSERFSVVYHNDDATIFQLR